MSDASSEGSLDGPPGRKPTPWSVRKIVEQVTGRPLESMQDPPGTRREPRASGPAPPRDPPLERYHEEAGPAITVLVEPESEGPRVLETREERDLPRQKALGEEEERSPTLRSFLPGAPAQSASGRPSRPSTLPITRPLPREVVEEVERMRADEGEPPLTKAGSNPHASRDLERVYLSYLLMHLDRLTEPALQYLRHAVEEECEERGILR